MTELTILEERVLNFIDENTDEVDLEMVDINDLANGLSSDAKVLRGVISSLVKKGKIWVEEYDSNGTVQYFYWTC